MEFGREIPNGVALLLQSLEKEEDSLLDVLTTHASTGWWLDLIVHEKQIFKTQIWH